MSLFLAVAFALAVADVDVERARRVVEQRADDLGGRRLLQLLRRLAADLLNVGRRLLQRRARGAGGGADAEVGGEAGAGAEAGGERAEEVGITNSRSS